jgi:hypothetical protein
MVIGFLFAPVSRYGMEPIFQAGHAGSIPGICSSSSAAYFERFRTCLRGFRARQPRSARTFRLGPRRPCCQYQAMVHVTVEASNDVDNPGVVKLQGETWELNIWATTNEL